MKQSKSATKMSGDTSFLSALSSDGERLTLHSRLKAWYYVSVKGYRVLRESAMPEPGLFGGISYRRTWVLGKPPSE